MVKTQLASDKFAMSISLICVVHCFLTPTFLILTSSILSFSLDNEFVHKLIVLIAVPVSIYALSLGYKNHKTISFFPVGITGLCILVLVVILGESTLGEFGEKGLTLLGSIMVAFAHYRNYQTCRKIDCNNCHD